MRSSTIILSVFGKRQKVTMFVKSSWILFPHAKWKHRYHDRIYIYSPDSQLSSSTFEHYQPKTHKQTLCLCAFKNENQDGRRWCNNGVFGKTYKFFLYNLCWEKELQVVHFMLSLLASSCVAILFIHFVRAVLRVHECVL